MRELLRLASTFRLAAAILTALWQPAHYNHTHSEYTYHSQFHFAVCVLFKIAAAAFDAFNSGEMLSEITNLDMERCNFRPALHYEINSIGRDLYSK